MKHLLKFNLKNFFFSIFGSKLMDTRLYPANIFLFKVNNRNTRKRCEICSKLIKTPERRHSIVDFEQVNVSWVVQPR